MRRAFVASVCVLLAGVLPALAQERIREERREGPDHGEMRRASAIMGSRVVVQEGEPLGEVVDMVINERGCIDFLIVRQEDQYIPIPWSVTTFNVQRRSVVVNTAIRIARLRELAFPRDRWPNFYGADYGRRLRGVWGERTFYRSGPGAPEEGRRDVRPEDRRDVRPGDRRDVRPEDRRPPDRRPDRTPPPPPRRDRSPNPIPPNPTPPQPPQG